MVKKEDGCDGDEKIEELDPWVADAMCKNPDMVSLTLRRLQKQARAHSFSASLWLSLVGW